MHEFSPTLQKVSLFKGLRLEQIESIAPLFKLIKKRNNSVVLHFNQEGHYLYILRSGMVRITVPHTGSNDEEVIATLRAGDYFGEMSLLTGEPISATVKTSLDSEFLALEKNDFKKLLREYSAIAYTMSMILSKRLRERNVYESIQPLPTKIGVFSSCDTETSTKFSVLLGLSLHLEGYNRILIIDFDHIAEDISDFHFEQAQEKLHSFIGTHDIGEDLKNIEGELFQFRPVASGKFPSRRANENYLSRYTLRKDEREYHYASGLFYLTIAPKNDELAINEGLIPPLLGLVTQIYDFVLINLGTTVTARTMRAMSQCDLSLYVGEKRPETVKVFKRHISTMTASEGMDCHRFNAVLFHSENPEDAVQKELNTALSRKDVVVPLFSVTKKAFDDAVFKEQTVFEHQPVCSGFGRMAREITNRKIGIALGGGGARGYAHIGVLKVLEQERFPVDVVSGSSMGALIAATYCLTGSAYETERIIRSELAEHGNIFDFTLPISAFLRGKRIRKISENIFKGATFSQLQIPLYIVCVDLISGKEIIINEGFLQTAVEASSAIPGIFKPVRYRDTYLVDGSVINKVPARILSENNASLIISVNVTPDRESSFDVKQEPKGKVKRILGKIPFVGEALYEPNILQVITRSLNINSVQMSRTGAQFTNFELSPRVEKFDFLNFKQFEPVVEAGYQTAKENLGQLRIIFNN